MQNKKKNVFLMEYIHPEAKKLLAAHTNILDRMDQISEADALINRNQVKVTKELLDKAVRLKVIGVHGTGLDAVDVPEAQKRGIEVFSTPGLNAKSVAELNVALALNLSRNISAAERTIRNGKMVSHEKQGFAGHEIGGRVFGLIGVGNIAKQTAAMLIHGFGAKVIGWSRSFTQEEAERLGIGYCSSKEEVLESADVILMGLALNQDTCHIIGEEQLKRCKSSALLINTARGKLIDEQALYKALTNGWIAGAASDVFEQEPVTADNPLVQLEHFLAVPHLGGNTEEALYRVGMAVVKGTLKRLNILE